MHFIPRVTSSGKPQLSWKAPLKSASGVAVIGQSALKLAGCPHHHFQAPPGFCPKPQILDPLIDIAGHLRLLVWALTLGSLYVYTRKGR